MTTITLDRMGMSKKNYDHFHVKKTLSKWNELKPYIDLMFKVNNHWK